MEITDVKAGVNSSITPFLPTISSKKKFKPVINIKNTKMISE
jgi:hypothetical protein